MKSLYRRLIRIRHHGFRNEKLEPTGVGLLLLHERLSVPSCRQVYGMRTWPMRAWPAQFTWYVGFMIITGYSADHLLVS